MQRESSAWIHTGASRRPPVGGASMVTEEKFLQILRPVYFLPGDIYEGILLIIQTMSLALPL